MIQSLVPLNQVQMVQLGMSWFNQTSRELLRGDDLISVELEPGRFTGLQLSAGGYPATIENLRISQH